ncbi:amidoligase family protein [Seongchinamella unica]|uniref:amidoligase family protein n=1 Tax=Seongchinamella unica TaxID=2547392 RepID=UPI001404EE2C|nr:amidoligase family protein [Seongchinamella unica]
MNKYLQIERPEVTATGESRRVGFELEFSGLTLDEISAAVAESMQGQVEPLSRMESIVKVEELGDFKVELDWQLGKVMARYRQQHAGSPDDEDPLMDWIRDVASEVVPAEVVCPPVAVDKLDCLDVMTETLREAGAVGTHGAPHYAFGVHINPELPDLEPTTIAAYLKAFCVAQNWLVKTHEVDLTRRITPYIDLFPAAYVATVLNYDESISLTQLMDDYLRHNPSRNRALDLLPLLRHLDEDRLVAVIDDDRIKSRPTFHYRLPNCSIEEQGWSLSDSWNLWCVIESLAHSPDILQSMEQQWLDRHHKLIKLDEPSWHKQLDKIRKDLLSE